MNCGVAFDHQLTALQPCIDDLDGRIHGQQQLCFRIAVVHSDRALIRAEGEASLHWVFACDHLRGEHQSIVVDRQ